MRAKAQKHIRERDGGDGGGVAQENGDWMIQCNGTKLQENMEEQKLSALEVSGDGGERATKSDAKVIIKLRTIVNFHRRKKGRFSVERVQ